MTAADDTSYATRETPADPADPVRPSATPLSAAAADTPAGTAIAAALVELDQLQGQPVEQHVDVYERAHGRLQAAMADADEA